MLRNTFHSALLMGGKGSAAAAADKELRQGSVHGLDSAWGAYESSQFYTGECGTGDQELPAGLCAVPIGPRQSGI